MPAPAVRLFVPPTPQAGFAAACATALAAANLPAGEKATAQKILTFYQTEAAASALGIGNYWVRIFYVPATGVGTTGSLGSTLFCDVTG